MTTANSRGLAAELRGGGDSANPGHQLHASYILIRSSCPVLPLARAPPDFCEKRGTSIAALPCRHSGFDRHASVLNLQHILSFELSGYDTECMPILSISFFTYMCKDRFLYTCIFKSFFEVPGLHTSRTAGAGPERCSP